MRRDRILGFARRAISLTTPEIREYAGHMITSRKLIAGAAIPCPSCHAQGFWHKVTMGTESWPVCVCKHCQTFTVMEGGA